MSKDPAFLFYPAEASEDTQFMNRLERGAYFDLVKSQRLFHGYTTVLLRKVLGKDFDDVWPSLELVLKHDETGYFIQWVRDSLTARKAFNQKQKERIEKRWNNHGNTAVLPVGNGIGIRNRDGNKNKKKGVQGEKEKNDLPVIHQPKTESLHARMIDLHSAWYEKKISIRYKFSGTTDGPAMSQIKAYITKSIADKRRIEPSDDDVINGWAFILESYDKWEPFYQKQLKISQINSNMPNIMANIKGINGNKTANNLASDIAEINEIGRRMREQAGSGKGG